MAVTAKTRDAAKSKAAILDAAEHLFAELGYDATSLQAIGRLAGVSRGTPAYFFGTKRALYEATLSRLFSDALDFAASLQSQLAQSGPTLRAVVVKLLRFLHGRPTLMQLIDREVLSGGTFIANSGLHIELVKTATDVLRRGLLGSPLSRGQARHYVLTLLGISAFPVTHWPLLKHLGFHSSGTRFLEERADHIVSILNSKSH